MKISFNGKFILIASMVALSTGLAVPVMAQASKPAEAVATTPASAMAGTSLTRAELKAQKKAVRTERRAEKNVQLKKLEAAGYTSGNFDPNYPQNIQNAEREAAGATGASQ
jgi:hypothetical protein